MFIICASLASAVPKELVNDTPLNPTTSAGKTDPTEKDDDWPDNPIDILSGAIDPTELVIDKP